MANYHEYICNGCGEPTRRDMLTVKKVVFTNMGEGSKPTRSRVKQWLCPNCVKQDSDWNIPPNVLPSERVHPSHFPRVMKKHDITVRSNTVRNDLA